MSDRRAYFDYGSTSPVRASVIEAMAPYHRDRFGNASSPYLLGRQARKAVNDARERVALTLGVEPDEIIFTSGGTESIIVSLVSAYAGNRHRGKHILTSTFEHHAVHAVFNFLREEMGADTELINVGRSGIFRLHELERKFRDDTILVSVMKVNNEVGTIQDLAAISESCSKRGIFVHSDYVQAIGKIPVDLGREGVDMACASGHKFGGPKGTGILYVKKGTYLKSICEGTHEFGIRSGTENVPGIVGISVALDEAAREIPILDKRMRKFKRQLWDCIIYTEPEAVLNGDQENCVAATMNFRLPGGVGEEMVLALDRAGIEVSTGSACQAGSVDPSHVLTAMGLGKIEAAGALRISMGYLTSQDDIDLFIEKFPSVYKSVRAEVSH